MRVSVVLIMTMCCALIAMGARVGAQVPTALPNRNTRVGGEMHGEVFRIALEARVTRWHPDGDSLPGILIEAFGERGKQPQVPGPLIRVVRGTEIRVSVTNSLPRDTLTFHVSVPRGADSIVVLPNDTRELRIRAAVPGTFMYHATTGNPVARLLRVAGLLGGA